MDSSIDSASGDSASIDSTAACQPCQQSLCGQVQGVVNVDFEAQHLSELSVDREANLPIFEEKVPIKADGQLCGPKVPSIDLHIAQDPDQAKKVKGGSIKKLQMLSGALKSVSTPRRSILLHTRVSI